ncbi:MAG: hypothetical protein OES79_04540 [Planctomycetota bacterium]|nr:hypothetical protein [Planctomycetota bacterium]
MTAVNSPPDRPAAIRSRYLLLCGLLLLAAPGCDLFKEPEGPKTKASPRKKVEPPPKQVDVTPPEPAPPAPAIELNVGGQTRKLPSCYLKLIPSTSQTPAVLMVTSYPNEQQESYPSFFMRVVLSGDDLAKLLGQPMPARIWFAAKPNDIVYHTPDGEPASVTIRNADDAGRVLGTIIDAKLLNTANDESMSISGQFDGLLE